MAADLVDDKSGDVYGALGTMHLPADYPGAPSLSQQWSDGCRDFVEFSSAVDDFSESARIALDNDGTKN
ncbi:hypothetical protein [Streptomyces sp. NPDC055299]